MFGKLKKAYKALRALKAADDGYRKGQKMAQDKPLKKSKAVWGAVVTSAAGALTAIGAHMAGEIDLWTMIGAVAAAVGFIVNQIGQRAATSKAINGVSK